MTSRQTAEYNTKANLREGISAKLVSGKDMTSKVSVKVREPGKAKFRKVPAGKAKRYKFKATGTYRVQYSVTNPHNKKAVAKKTARITVKDTKKPRFVGFATRKAVEFGAVVDLKEGLGARLGCGRDVTARIRVSAKTPDRDTFISLSSRKAQKYAFKKAGDYIFEYRVSNPNNKAAVRVRKMRVTVSDTRVPQIRIGADKPKEAFVLQEYGVYDMVDAALPDGTQVPLAAVITGTDGNGQKIAEIPDIIGGKAVFTVEGSYTITYIAVNPNNTEKTAAAEFGLAVRRTDSSPDQGMPGQPASEKGAAPDGRPQDEGSGQGAQAAGADDSGMPAGEEWPGGPDEGQADAIRESADSVLPMAGSGGAAQMPADASPPAGRPAESSAASPRSPDGS